MISPESYIPFRDEEEYRDKCIQWGLFSDKAKTLKKEFLYKGTDITESAALVGYLDSVFAVIKLASGRFHSIHPSFLKEMQTAKFVYPTNVSAAVKETEEEEAPSEEVETAPVIAPPAAKPDKKLVLPEGKTALLATVDRFDTRYDPFAEGEQEVILFRDVSWSEEEPELIAAWSSFSATLKKADLREGDRLTLEGKLAARKFDNNVRVKINNAAKIAKIIENG